MELPDDITRLSLAYCTQPIYGVIYKTTQNYKNKFSPDTDPRFARQVIKKFRSNVEPDIIYKNPHWSCISILRSNPSLMNPFKLLDVVPENLEDRKFISDYLTQCIRTDGLLSDESKKLIYYRCRIPDFILEYWEETISPPVVYFSNMQLIPLFALESDDYSVILGINGPDCVYLVKKLIEKPGINLKLIGRMASMKSELVEWLNSNPEFICSETILLNPADSITRIVLEVCGLISRTYSASTENIYKVIANMYDVYNKRMFGTLEIPGIIQKIQMCGLINEGFDIDSFYFEYGGINKLHELWVKYSGNLNGAIEQVKSSKYQVYDKYGPRLIKKLNNLNLITIDLYLNYYQ